MAETLKHPDYDRHYAEWKRTLPNASHELLHDKVLKHLAFKEQIRAVTSKPQVMIPCQFFPVKCEFQAPPATKIHWELRAIVILLGLILLSMVAKIAHGEPAPPLPIPYTRVMMLPQAGTVPIPLPVQGSGSSNPVYVICSSGCSAAGAFADNSSFTVGTTPGSILFGYYTSGAAPTLTSGSAARARIDANSYLAVDCVTGCSASAGFADNSAFTAGTTAIGITGGWYAASPTACTTGNACAPSMTSDRKMFVQDFQGTSPWVVSNSGTFAVQAAQSGTWTVTGAGGTFPVTGTFWQATQPVSGTFWQTTQPVSGTFWQATQPVSLTSTTITGTVAVTESGTWTVQPGNTANTTPWLATINQGGNSATVTASNALKVDGSAVTQPVSGTFWQTTQPVSGTFWQATQPVSGSVTVTQATGTNLHAVLDTTSTTAVTQATASNLNAAVVGVGTAGSPSGGILTVQGVASMTKLLVTPDSVALPANQSVNVSQVGGTAVLADPCQANAKVYTLISVTTGTQLVTGTSGKKQYICSIQLITATAQNVAIVEGTGTVCASSTLGLLGGASAATGWNLAANGGLTYGNGSSALAATTVNANNVCILTSSSGQISGNMVSVAQ